MTEVERLQAAIARLRAFRDYPVPAYVERAQRKWARKSAIDAHAAWQIILLSDERACDAYMGVLAYGATLTGPIPPAILGLASAILGEQDT